LEATLVYPEVKAAACLQLQEGLDALPVSEALTTTTRAMDAVFGDRTFPSAIF